MCRVPSTTTHITLITDPYYYHVIELWLCARWRPHGVTCSANAVALREGVGSRPSRASGCPHYTWPSSDGLYPRSQTSNPSWLRNTGAQLRLACSVTRNQFENCPDRQRWWAMQAAQAYAVLKRNQTSIRLQRGARIGYRLIGVRPSTLEGAQRGSSRVAPGFNVCWTARPELINPQRVQAPIVSTLGRGTLDVVRLWRLVLKVGWVPTCKARPSIAQTVCISY